MEMFVLLQLVNKFVQDVTSIMITGQLKDFSVCIRRDSTHHLQMIEMHCE